MERAIKATSDGSKTLFISELNEGYHSHHGALQEAEHVFIKNGIKNISDYDINILELGFGTGLNAMVTINEYLKNPQGRSIHYFTLEKYPVKTEEIIQLSYHELFDFETAAGIFEKLHACEWDKTQEILPGFTLTKFHCDFFQLKDLDLTAVKLVYYDCFGARVQPDLWEKPLFEMVKEKMAVGGLLTTYSSKGSVRRILQELNFKVSKLEGPPGKREMINATLLP